MTSYKLIQTKPDGTHLVLCYCADRAILEQLAQECGEDMPEYQFDVFAREHLAHSNTFS